MELSITVFLDIFEGRRMKCRPLSWPTWMRKTTDASSRIQKDTIDETIKKAANLMEYIFFLFLNITPL